MPDDELQTTTTDDAGDTAPASLEAPGSQGETTANNVPLSEKFKDFLVKSAEATDKTDDTPTEEDTEDQPDANAKEEPKADTKTDAKAKTEDGDTEEVDEEDLELLSGEDIDKRFPNSPKGLRGYAKAVTAKYAPYVEAIEQLGGLEAVKRLDSLSVLATGEPELKEDGNIDKFIDSLNKTNPSFSEALQTKLFYGAIDENPALLDTLIKTNMGEQWNSEGLKPLAELGPEWTGQKLVNLAQMVDSGEIDLEDIQEKLDAADPKEAERRKLQADKETKDAEEKAELQKRVDAIEAKDKQTARESDVRSVWSEFAKVVEPIQKKFGLLNFISKDDPEDIKAVKTEYLNDLGNAIGRRLEQNPLFRTLAQKIDTQQKGDDYAWLGLKCANIYKGIYREEAAKRAPLLAAYLKEYGGPVKEVKTRRPEPDKDASQTTHPSTKGKVEDSEERALSQEERREALAKLMVEKEAERGRHASAA